MTSRAGHTHPRPTPSSTQEHVQEYKFESRAASDIDGFGLSEHLALLHPDSSSGLDVWLAQKSKRWSQWSVPTCQLSAEALHLAGLTDVYLAQQQFRSGGRRTVNEVRRLASLTIDLDYGHDEAHPWAGRPPEEVASAVLATLDRSDLPWPAIIISSGRGLYATWTHMPVGPDRLTDWRAVAGRLSDALSDYAPDRGASCDPARVYRLVGTCNSRADGPVRAVWLGPDVDRRPDFDELLRLVHPPTPATVIALAPERARRRAAGVPGPAPARPGAAYQDVVLADLLRLVQHRYPGGQIPAGRRDVWVLWVGNALSWTVPMLQLLAEADRLTGPWTGWSRSELRERLAAVLQRAGEAAAGQTRQYRGRDVDPRYRVRPDTLARRLDVSLEEAEAAGLAVVRPGRGGSEPVATHKERAERRALMAPQAHALRAAGLSWPAVARQLGVSEAQVRRVVRATPSESVYEGGERVGGANIGPAPTASALQTGGLKRLARITFGRETETTDPPVQVCAPSTRAPSISLPRHPPGFRPVRPPLAPKVPVPRRVTVPGRLAALVAHSRRTSEDPPPSWPRSRRRTAPSERPRPERDPWARYLDERGWLRLTKAQQRAWETAPEYRIPE